MQGGDTVLVKEAGIPDITGSATTIYALNSVTSNGALTYTQTGAPEISGTSSATVFGTINFNASRSNEIYGSADTVQPPAIRLIPQIKF